MAIALTQNVPNGARVAVVAAILPVALLPPAFSSYLLPPPPFSSHMRRGTLASFSFIALTIFDSSIDFIARLPAAHFQFCGADEDDDDDDA